jgi:hypothetical protein
LGENNSIISPNIQEYEELINELNKKIKQKDEEYNILKSVAENQDIYYKKQIKNFENSSLATEDTTKMLTEILEEFIIYMYNECKNEDLNYKFILNNFIECNADDTTQLFIFNLFKKNIYYNQSQEQIKYYYFTYHGEEDDEINYEEYFNNYNFITSFFTRYYKIELTEPFMIDFINSVIDNLQPILK